MTSDSIEIHCLKFTTVGGPDGLCESLSFVLGRRQDKYGLRNSGVNTEMGFIQAHRPLAEHKIIYLDKGYESLTYCRAAHRGIANRNIVWKIIENTKMKRPRGVCIEMPYGKTLACSKLLEHHKGLKIQASSVVKEYFVAMLLNNAHTCIYGSNVAEYFDCEPPTLSEWMRCPTRGIHINI